MMMGVSEEMNVERIREVCSYAPKRLRQIVKAIITSDQRALHELTMSIPVQRRRDADCVLSDVANVLDAIPALLDNRAENKQ